MPRIKERQSPQGQVHAVALALRILELLATNAKPTRVTDLAGELGTSKNRIHRHLQTLVEAGYAVRDVDTQRYMPGIRLLQLGNAVANHTAPQAPSAMAPHSVGPQSPGGNMSMGAPRPTSSMGMGGSRPTSTGAGGAGRTH